MRMHHVVVIALLCGGTALAAQTPSSERFEALVGLARVKREAGDVRAARAYFEQARDVKPLEPSLETEYFWLLTEAAPAEAIVVGQALLRQNPAADDVRERSIAVAVASGQEGAALALAREGTLRQPERVSWHRLVAGILVRQGQADEAIRAWEAALRATGSDDMDRAGLAFALEATGAHQRALAVWDQIPAGRRLEHEDWQRSRLRMLMHSGRPADAASEVSAWLQTHTDDVQMREALVELWSRAGEPQRARSTLQPLLEGNERRRWLRRDAQLARATGAPAAAIERLQEMAASGLATRGDRLALVELFVDQGEFARAVGVIRTVGAEATSCVAEVFPLIDRIPGAVGTGLLGEQLKTHDCRRLSPWIERGIERNTADGQHAEALAMLEALPSERRSTLGMRRLEGQLRLWTGDAAASARILAPVVAESPTDVTAIEALVDAYRGNGNPYAAWRAAEWLLSAPTTSAARLLALAELALEADRPEMVDEVLDRLPPAAAPSAIRVELQGRALSALGRPADAVRLLSSVPLSGLSPSAALALVDSLHTTRGVQPALEVARAVRVDVVTARDLAARLVMLEALSPSGASTRVSKAELGAVDPALPIFVDAEVALAQERPLDALASLAVVPSGPHAQRASDLRVTALAGSGNLEAAFSELQTLRQARSAFTPLMLRETELAWRLRRSPQTLAEVLALPARFPANRHAATTAARALAFEQRHEHVIAVLGGLGASDELTVEGRVLMARSLFASGRAGDALQALAGLDLRGPASTFHAELTARVQGVTAGVAAFRALAARPDATADVFMAWAAITSEATDRLEILSQGARRFADHAPLFATLAVAHAAAGDLEASRVAAERSVALDADSGEAWFQLLAATSAVQSRVDLAALLARFGEVAASRPALAVATADRTAALVRSATDPLLTAALHWVRVDIDDPSLQVSRDLALVRLFAAGQRWFEALEAADAAVARHPEAVAALRLRADVLSWAGRHDEGLGAYDDYLAVVPGDIEARRQQARVAGWAGRFADARAYYAALLGLRPDDEAIAAEAEAKVALFEGRWRRAVEAYDAWLLVEPDNSEARFELASALRAAGDLERADATLSALSPEGGHRLAEASRDREAWRREPSVAVTADLSSANGYEGQRLLDLRTTGAVMHSVFGRSGRTTLAVEAASVGASSAEARRSGYQIGASGVRRLTPTVNVDGQISLWDVSGPGNPSLQASATGAWSPADRWTLLGGAGRELLLDNIASIDRRLAATGAFLGAALETPSASVAVRSNWQRLSDGNRRHRLSMSATRALSERWNHIRAIAWAEWLDYARPAETYFAPARFLRVDGGLEYTQRLSQPRFRGDRMDQVAVGYLLGTDSRGAIYQHPSVRLSWEVSSAMALSVRGDVIRSRSYNEQSLLVSLHLLGGSFSR